MPDASQKKLGHIVSTAPEPGAMAPAEIPEPEATVKDATQPEGALRTPQSNRLRQSTCRSLLRPKPGRVCPPAASSSADALLNLLEGQNGDAADDADEDLLNALRASTTSGQAAKQVDPEDNEKWKSISSKTHRSAYMRLSRFMAGDEGPAFPEMQKLWNGTQKERLDLLRTWVTKDENRGACESSVTMSREQSEKYKATQVLMSVKDMLKADMPKNKIKAVIHRGGGVPDADAPDELMLTQFWVTERRMKSREEVRCTRSETRVRAETDFSTYDAPLQVPGARAPHTYISEVQQALDSAMSQTDPTATGQGFVVKRVLRHRPSGCSKCNRRHSDFGARRAKGWCEEEGQGQA